MGRFFYSGCRGNHERSINSYENKELPVTYVPLLRCQSAPLVPRCGSCFRTPLVGMPVARRLELELGLIQPHMTQKPVLRREVGCACVAREVSVERGGMGERGCARPQGGVY